MEAVLFDLDGTLMDTSEGVLESFFYVIDRLNYPVVPQNEVKSMIGTPVQEWFKKFYGVDNEIAQYATELFREHNLKYSSTKATVYSGVYELLEELLNRNIKIGVATYKREDCAFLLLQNFGILKYCSSFHGADNYNKLSKMDIINICLDELVVNRENVVIVGDTAFDAQGAFNAGIQFIGVTYGLGFKNLEEIEKYPHIGFVDNIADVIKFL